MPDNLHLKEDKKRQFVRALGPIAELLVDLSSSSIEEVASRTEESIDFKVVELNSTIETLKMLNQNLLLAVSRGNEKVEGIIEFIEVRNKAAIAKSGLMLFNQINSLLYENDKSIFVTYFEDFLGEFGIELYFPNPGDGFNSSVMKPIKSNAIKANPNSLEVKSVYSPAAVSDSKILIKSEVLLGLKESKLIADREGKIPSGHEDIQPEHREMTL